MNELINRKKKVVDMKYLKYKTRVRMSYWYALQRLRMQIFCAKLRSNLPKVSVKVKRV